MKDAVFPSLLDFDWKNELPLSVAHASLSDVR